jgi:hypothetical protein
LVTLHLARSHLRLQSLGFRSTSFQQWGLSLPLWCHTTCRDRGTLARGRVVQLRIGSSRRYVHWRKSSYIGLPKSCLACNVVLLLIVLSSLFQMIHANANHNIRYMPNARHGAYPAMLPQGFPSAMVSQQHDGSSITTAVASAEPADQQQVIMHHKS